MSLGVHRNKAITACFVAALGTTTLRTAARLTVTTTRLISATTTTVFVLPQLRCLAVAKSMTRWHPALYLAKDKNKSYRHASKKPERLPISCFKVVA